MGGGGGSCECFHFYGIFNGNFCKDRVDPDQTHFVASELDLHCLLTNPKGISGLKRVNYNKLSVKEVNLSAFKRQCTKNNKHGRIFGHTHEDLGKHALP